jgi:hypothetical protein
MVERHTNVSKGGSIRHVLAEAMRQLHPRRQLEQGPGFFLYAGAVAATIAGPIELVARRGHPGLILVLSLLLWLILFIGEVLLVLKDGGPDSPGQGNRRKGRSDGSGERAPPSKDDTRGSA